MQGFLSRVARLPSSGCRCKTCLRTYVNGVATRPATASSRRGLRTANAVTALYGSIFASATIADALSKRKRRQEWEDKIAAVQEEIDELMDEERRLLEALSARKTRQTSAGALQSWSYRAGAQIETRNAQTLANRAFSTKAPIEKSAADDYAVESDWTISDIAGHSSRKADIDETAFVEETLLSVSTRESASDEETGNFEYETFDEDLSNMNNMIPRPEPDFKWERSSIVRIKAIQKLAIQQLVYRMILRPSVAHDYSGLPVEYRLDEPSTGSPNALLNRLRGVRRRLYSLKYIRDAKFDDLMQNFTIEELETMRDDRDRYDILLKRDLEQYANGKLSLQQLLMQVSDNLLTCQEPDRPVAFSLLINAFTRWHQNDLADLVLKCLIPNLFKLSTPLIVAIISHFRKTKNLKDFDLFLQMLRGEGGYSVNLRTTWVKRNVNGITITVPPTGGFSPVLITSVITATLRFDQPEKAEAYMQVARAHGFIDNLDTLSAFLRFYAIRNDFETGLSTLVRALNYMISSSDFEEDRIARLILCMADFSARCGRYNLSTTLIQAAVQSGFDYSLVYISERSELNYLLGTFKKWRKAQAKVEMDFSQQQQLPLHEKCTRFADLTAAKIIHLQHMTTHYDNDTSPTLSLDLPDEPQITQLSSKYAKLQSDTNKSPATQKSTTSYPVEPSVKIKNLRSQEGELIPSKALEDVFWFCG
ncbi:conserved hypothetical protein [Talaromyces stipitatus ATCC 10500]|uniref:Uncharacterized protein n=1 Tax=Talaromyces stipitatus (strain ATCC 10500 / CBS 375.48 / QM 6759 / NRRL 1006) TaxID=441959 RepID=B8LY44_TALSN|nr:uncharacterized protein TSTA_067290 [Talaromyces stipitatus ATCC 10500]EED23289.1 conserved hypothetical protein [Talaromyces stipitatus ATCC 10500]